MQKVDLAVFSNSWWRSGRNRYWFALWRGIGLRVFHFIPSEPIFFGRLCENMKASILRAFGAKLGVGSVIRSDVDIYIPWNLEMGDHVWIGSKCQLYSLTKIKLGNNVCISQNTFLCTGSHDYHDPHMGLIVGEICVDDGAWIGANVFVHPDVQIGEECVVAAGSVVTGSLPMKTLCGGMPCHALKKRNLRDASLGPGGGIKANGRVVLPPASR